MIKVPDTFKNGVCLFCMQEAKESHSNHGQCFDGYYCYCTGQMLLKDALRGVNKVMRTANENRDELDRLEEISRLGAEQRRIEARMKELGA